MMCFKRASSLPLFRSTPILLAGAVVSCLLAAGFFAYSSEVALEKTPGSFSPPLPTPPPVVPSTRIISETNLLSPPAMRMVRPGVVALGKVIVDEVERTVTFPAVVNQCPGPLEYLIVTFYGKNTESLLRTEVLPYHIQSAMLLLGARGATNNISGPPSDHIVAPVRGPISGDKVTIEVKWESEGQPVQRAAEGLVYNVEAKTILSPGAWAYNGSAVWGGRFLAQENGSIVSLVTDLGALMNHGGHGQDNRQTWTANATNLPPANTPVEVTFRLGSTVASN